MRHGFAVAVRCSQLGLAAAGMLLSLVLFAAPLLGSDSSTLDEALQHAVLAADTGLVADLVAQGADPSEGLIAAARTGNLSLLELLVASGADPQGFFGARALVVAFLTRQEEAAAFLETRGASLGTRDEAGRTVLVWAAGQRRLGPLVLTAIRRGADINAASRTGETALMTATRYGRVGSVRMLLRAGADVGLADRDGWTALMFAVRSQNKKIVGLLIAAGADCEAESTLGWTALMLAARDGGGKAVLRLLRAGANADHQTRFQPQPLIHAIQGGNATAVRLLLKHGAQVGSGLRGDPMWWARSLKKRRIRILLVKAAGVSG